MKKDAIIFLIIMTFCLAMLPVGGLALGDESEDAYLGKGINSFQKGQFDQATADFTKALEINPGNFKAHYHRGLAYYAKGQLDQAIADFTKASELNPGFAEAYLSLAKAFYDRKSYDQAWENVNLA
jgi:tetratricopeptide (TPR) repeat protein